MKGIVSDVPNYTGAGVYALIDDDGKLYIGSSMNISKRVKEHRSRLSRAVQSGQKTNLSKLEQAALDGKTFRAKILELLPETGSTYDLWDMEQKHLDAAGGTKNTYNVRGFPAQTREMDYSAFYYWSAKDSDEAREICERLQAKILERTRPIFPHQFPVNISIPKDVIRAHAEAHNESMNAFIVRAISEAMERDKEEL